MELLYWHWVIIGIGLILLELFIPSFTALWFGLGAVFVGLVLAFEPSLSLTVQVSMWASTSAVLTLLWFKYLKPAPKHGETILLSDVEGEIGLVLTKPTASRSGKVRFATPLLGLDEWDFQSDDNIDIGDQVEVTNVQDGVLIMSKR